MKKNFEQILELPSFIFFCNDINQNTAKFNKEESWHCIKVLRHKIGDLVWFTDGKGYLYEGAIASNNPDKCVINIIRTEYTHNKSQAKLTIAIAPSKNQSRYEFFIEKAVEIGIYKIQPIICKRGYKINFKQHRIEKIVLSAMKQSLKTFLPEINQPLSFADFCVSSNEKQKFIAHYDKYNVQLLDIAKSFIDTVIVIGPEGDFTDEEINFATSQGFVPINLGNSRLRTETAALTACVLFNSINL